MFLNILSNLIIHLKIKERKHAIDFIHDVIKFFQSRPFGMILY